jgi:tRNA(Ile)-lysidine synthase
MQNIYQRFISNVKFFADKKHLLVAVSGGADSVVLLNLVSRFVQQNSDYSFSIAHCNFKLRGQSSLRDADFVEQLAKFYEVPLYTIEFETAEYARSKGISIEMAARELRYGFFEKILSTVNNSACLLAHHKNDNVETFFLNLLRGTGIRGLRGMPAQSGKYVRPLLDCSKNEILEYAAAEQINYVEDETNSDTVFLRNNIRHNVIPLMQTLNPQAIEHISNTMQTLGSVEKILDRWFSAMFENVIVDGAGSVGSANGVGIIGSMDSTGGTDNTDSAGDTGGMGSTGSITLSIPALQAIEQLTLFLELLLQPYNFSRGIISQISESITDGTAGKIFYSQTHIVRRERNTVIIEETPPHAPSADLVALSDSAACLASTYAIPIPPRDNNFTDIPPMLNYNKQFFVNINEVPKDSTIAALAINKIKEPLILRKWKDGDFFYPLGMNQKQKLSDFFNNNKFSSIQKRNTWVLTHKSDIVWIVGHRIDDRYKLRFPKGTGVEALIITISR